MAERLREIAHLPLCSRIILLGQEPNVIPKRENPLEHRTRIRSSARQDEIVGIPKAAGDEGSLARRQPVFRLARVVAEHQIIEHQTPLDRGKRAGYARVIDRQKTDQRHEQ